LPQAHEILRTETVDQLLAAIGDVANKTGTYPLALAAARHAVPFVVVASESTVDRDMPDGGHIVIEQRPADEVTRLAQIEVFNPAFNVTPPELVTAVTTEERTISPGTRPARAPCLAVAADGVGG
jgi:methylthioribose-1-phosphate isomerase